MGRPQVCAAMGLTLAWLLTGVSAWWTSASAASASFAALPSEGATLEAVAKPDFDLASVSAEDVEQLVHKGWHEAVRAIVRRSHSGSEEEVQRVATQVRQAVKTAKNRLDDLIRALDRNYGRAVDVSPSMQWAQNSTHVFIAVKFAQRWNAPGALQVENETVAFSSCCFNFTAFGEHSLIRRRYHLSFELFMPAISAASSWSWAAAGRMTVIVAKAKAANWPRLYRDASAIPKNLGIWRDMREKWKEDLSKLPEEQAQKPAAASAAPPKAAGKASKKAKRKSKVSDDEDDDALDAEIELLSECTKSSYAGTSVAEICKKSWQGVVETPAVRGRRWLVELYSSTGDGDLEAMRVLMPMWKRLADMFPSMAPGGRVGALDCGGSLEKELCKKLGVSPDKLPQVRRFIAGGQGDIWTGSLDASTSIEALAAWGHGKDEL